MRLFCFPHAGGSATAYRTWAKSIAADVEVCAVALPGRGARSREAPVRRLSDLVGELVPRILERADRPYAFFGHSLGGLIAFELARALEPAGLAGCSKVIVSASPAPDQPRPSRVLSELSDEELLRWLQRTGGVPRPIVESREALAAFLPAFRADLGLIETYQIGEARALRVPLAVMGGASDTLVTRTVLSSWKRWTTGMFSLRLFSGGHFYMGESLEAPLAFVEQACAACLRD